MSENTYAVTARRLPSFQVGGGYAFQFATVGGVGDSTFAIVGGAAPAGATLSATGLFSYAGRAVGKYSFTVQATDGSAQTAVVAVVFEVYGASFGQLGLNTVPTAIVEATDRVGAVRASLPAWLRHFAKLPEPSSADFAHFASDIGVDPEQGEAYQSLAAVFAALWSLSVAEPERVDIEDVDGDDAGTPYRTYRIGNADAAFYLGTGDAASMRTQFRFVVDGTDQEWVNADGYRLKVVEIKTVDGEVVAAGSNHVDARGFWTNRTLAGNPVVVPGLVLKVEIDVTGPGTDEFPVDDQPQVLCGVARALSALEPDALLTATRFFTSAEARAAQGGAAAVTTIDGDPVPVSGAIAFVGERGLTPSYDSGSGEVTVELAATVNGVGFSVGGELTLEAGAFITLTPDVGANKIRIDASPGLATLNSRAPVGNNFTLQSSTPSFLTVTVIDGLASFAFVAVDATPTSRGLMTTTQAAQLAQLVGGTSLELHRHPAHMIKMGATVNSDHGLFAFTADTTVAELLAQINDYLATQYVDPGIGMLTGQSLTATGGDDFVTAMISNDAQTPAYGVQYAVDYEAGDVSARVRPIVGTPTLEYTVAAFSGANQGDVELYLNGALIDAVTLTGSTGTFTGANGKLEVVVTATAGSLTLKQGAATITIEAADLAVGYNVLRLSHAYAVGDVRDAADYAFFADANDAGWTGGALTVGATGTPYYLSGVPYYAAAEHLLLHLAAVGDFALTTVLASPARWRIGAGSWTSISRSAPEWIGLSSPPDVRDTPTLTAYNTTTDVGSLADGFAVTVEGLSAAADPPLSKTTTENTHFRLLRVADSVAAEAAATETFIGETYRTKQSTWSNYSVAPTVGAPSGQIRLYGWNSGVTLPAVGASPWGEAGSFTEAQVTPGALRWPTTNYPAITGLIPAHAGWLVGAGGDYSAFSSAAAVWYDRYIPTATTKTILRIRVWCSSHDLRTETGPSWLHSNGADHKKFNLEMRLPTATPWLDCASPAVGGYGVAGAGVLRSAIQVGSDAFGTYYDFNVVTGAGVATRGIVLRMTLRHTGVVIRKVLVTDAAGGAL